MKTITAFYLYECPYCRNAKAALQELVQEDPEYGKVSVEWFEETEHPELLSGHPHYYVPSLFIGSEKLYEAQPGQDYDTIKGHVRSALDRALQ